MPRKKVITGVSADPKHIAKTATSRGITKVAVATTSKTIKKTSPPSKLNVAPKGKRKAEIEDGEPEAQRSKVSRGGRDADVSSSAPRQHATLTAAKKAEKEEPKDSKRKIAKPRATKSKVVLNHAPSKRLNIYVFGTNEGGELGLGSGCSSTDVNRPRLNPNLLAASVGVVQMATGGMHCAVLTHDNRILTWGVNDLGALGRNTTWDGGMVDVKDDDSEADSESALNPKEATPTVVDASSIPEGTIFTQVAAGDNATFALTDDGLVYGWGTFRTTDGSLGFTPDIKIQPRPALIQGVQKATKLVANGNHALALTSSGTVFAWGVGEQYQLGRRIMERTRLSSLIPTQIGPKKGIVDIGGGSDHSFAIHQNGKVYCWGLNNFGQTGIAENAGEDEAAIMNPMVVSSLSAHGRITCIDGGRHHSIAVTEEGTCLVWGRVDTFGLGLKIDILKTSDVVQDERGKPRILKEPTRIPELDAVSATAGSDHSIAITREGKAYSWGFNPHNQTGLGTDEDVECATLIDNTAVRGKKLVWAGAGGQYSVLAGEDVPLTNGIS
ncbi:hypothetical protein MMC13_007057 [Lambiella insularis]|nr:hypothetical protein [Lambiella insularis]